MANPLTGDFDAVLQVSGSTVNRLLASMHQNAFADPSRPSFPHSVKMRIGDTFAYEGVRGLAYGQVSTPRVELIDGATDRFRLKVWVRVWYRPDPGTNPLPAYINGLVQAEYRLHDVPASCRGWSKDSSDYLWFRVVRDSVTFEGTADDDIDLLSAVILNPGTGPGNAQAANIDKVTAQIARLLAKRFEAMPHKVSPRFRRGSMRSLDDSEVGSAVVIPVGLDGDPVGNINSVNQVLLGGADLAVAVSRDYIMGLANQMVQPFANFKQTVHVHVSTPWPAPDIDTDYHVGMNPPVVTWLPQGNYAIIKIQISGAATTGSILPNVTFDIDQDVTLNFSGNFWLAPGSASWKVHVEGLYSGTVADAVSNYIKGILPAMVQNACNAANPSLAPLTQQTGELTDRLRSLDAAAGVSLDWAEFLNEGVIVRGTIGLSGRKKPSVQQSLTPTNDAHSALESWIPGGRIDRLEWSWTWANSGEKGNATLKDRFLLQRSSVKPSRWGLALEAKTPLPGLDGYGTVCLRITGVVTDPVTGAFVRVTSVQKCRRFGMILTALIGDGYAYLRDIPELVKEIPFPPMKNRGLVAIGRNPAAGSPFNTLVLLLDEGWDREIAGMLGGGLDACRRYDAGLSVLVLFKEGVLDGRGPDFQREIQYQIQKFGILGDVNEDVGGSWSRTLGLQERGGAPGWAVITPEGTVPWTQIGGIDPFELGSALDTHLRRATDVKPRAYQHALKIGSAIYDQALSPSIGDLIDEMESPCPPAPVGKLGLGDTVLAFVNVKSEASIANLHTVLRTGAGQDRTVIAVVDGVDPKEIDSWQRQQGLDLVALADPDGVIGGNFGIDVWPTTVTVTKERIVSDILVGLGAHDREAEIPNPKSPGPKPSDPKPSDPKSGGRENRGTTA